MKYMLVEGEDKVDLEAKVNFAIAAEWWKPQGGVSVMVSTGYNTCFYQAMVKEN